MKRLTAFGSFCVLVAVGCQPPLPEKPRATGPLADPARAEERIKETLANPKFTQAEKDQIIATIKSRNHMR